MTVVEQLRELGLAMGSWYAPQEQEVRDEEGEPTGETITVRRFVGWTTDEAKANAAQELGAMLRPYRSSDPTCNGWDVSVSEVIA